MKQATAEVCVGESVTHAHGVDIPTPQSVIYTDDPREAYASKLEDLARRIRSGELNGCSAMWNESPDQPAMVVVEVDPIVEGRPASIRMTRSKFEKPEERMRLLGKAV